MGGTRHWRGAAEYAFMEACTWPPAGDACRQDNGLKTTAGGAVSFAPPPTPKPSTTSRTGWGGVQNCIWDAWAGKPEEDIGRPEPEGWELADGRMMGDGRWGGPDTGWERLNTRYGWRGGKKDERREETGKMFCRARHPDESRRGEKGRNQKSSLTGNIES